MWRIFRTLTDDLGILKKLNRAVPQERKTMRAIMRLLNPASNRSSEESSGRPLGAREMGEALRTGRLIVKSEDIESWIVGVQGTRRCRLRR